MSEQWRKVAVRPDRYEVSDLGRVRSVFPDGRTSVRQTFPRQGGYLRVSFRLGGRLRTFDVHRLVALAFLGEPTGPLVRHLDGDPANNVPANLAYGTSADNNRDTVLHGRNPQRQKAACNHGHPFDDKNTHVDARGRRHCRACAVVRSTRYREAQKEVSS